ncbi:hypothetical protein EV363DRAFT_1535146 [Boletus edulis]|nr:hypothetical protein EV363DRAFT_1535146 [Boletus edulis]
MTYSSAPEVFGSSRRCRPGYLSTSELDLSPHQAQLDIICFKSIAQHESSQEEYGLVSRRATGHERKRMSVQRIGTSAVSGGIETRTKWCASTPESLTSQSPFENLGSTGISNLFSSRRLKLFELGQHPGDNIIVVMQKLMCLQTRICQLDLDVSTGLRGHRCQGSASSWPNRLFSAEFTCQDAGVGFARVRIYVQKKISSTRRLYTPIGTPRRGTIMSLFPTKEKTNVSWTSRISALLIDRTLYVM